MLEITRTALLVIDMQKAFDEIAASGVARNNPGAEANASALLAAFRKRGGTVIHIRHASREIGSKFRTNQPGFAPLDCAVDLPGETVLVKSVNSAFVGTGLETMLTEQGITTLVIIGATTNHCVETTTRMAGNLGFRALLVRDATWTFDRTGVDGEHHKAHDIHQMTLSNLSEEFAEIVTAADILALVTPHHTPAEAWS